MEIVNEEIIINFSSPLSTLYYFFQMTRIIEIKKLIKNEDDLKYNSSCREKYHREINLVKILQRFHDQLFLFYSVLKKKPLLVPVPRIISYNRIGAFSILDNLVDDKIT